MADPQPSPPRPPLPESSSGAAGTHRITSARRLTPNSEFLNGLGPFLMRERDPDQLIRRTLLALAKHLNSDRANWGEFSADRSAVVVREEYLDGTPGTVSTHLTAEFVDPNTRSPEESGRGLVVHDVATGPFNEEGRENFRRMNVGAFLIEQLVTEKGPKALIGATSCVPRRWRPDEEQLLREVAIRLFPAVERARAERLLQESEENYRTLFETIDEGFCVVEVLFDTAGKAWDYRFLEVNPSFEKLTGIADAPGKTVRELAPNPEERWIEIFGRVALTGGSERFEGHSKLVGKWFEVYANRHGDGANHRVAILFSDITERKQTETALRESEERLRIFVEHAPAAVAMFDRGMRYLAVSRRWMMDYGIAGDVLGRCQYEVFPNIPARWRESHRLAMEGSVEMTAEDRFTRPDGTGGWLMWEVRPWYDGAGAIGGIVIFSEDITSAKRARDELADLNHKLESRVTERTRELERAVAALEVEIAERRQAEEHARQLSQQLAARVEELAAANAELETFGYTVSHDLRAPLRHVSGYVRLLAENLDGKLDPETLEYIPRILGATSRMGQLIDGLLDFSRLGRTNLRRTKVDLGRLVGEVRATLHHAEDGRSIEWKIGPLPTVSGDAAMLRQVLANLLENAIKFTRRQPAAVIEVSSTSDPSGHVVRVRDNGAGFDPAYGSKLFGVFQRLHSERDFEGTGIGLATVQRIALRHGGRAWAESRPGEGASFYFSLPE